MVTQWNTLSKLKGIRAFRHNLRDTWLVDQCRSVKRRVMRRSEGEAFLLRRYVRIHGKPLNVANPQTFTEKLFWRMITWNRGDMPSRFTQLADKYAVRAHVASTVGKEYLIKLLWQGNDPHAIPFDRLPAEYVIKPSHAAGQVIIVKGQADRDEIIRTVSGWLASNYYWHGREYQYYGIPPRIVIEEYLTNEDGSPPLSTIKSIVSMACPNRLSCAIIRTTFTQFSIPHGIYSTSSFQDCTVRSVGAKAGQSGRDACPRRETVDRVRVRPHRFL